MGIACISIITSRSLTVCRAHTNAIVHRLLYDDDTKHMAMLLSAGDLEALAEAGLLPPGMSLPPPPPPRPDDAPEAFCTELAPHATTSFRRRHVPDVDEEAALADMKARDDAATAALEASGWLEGAWRTLPRTAPDGRPWTPLTLYVTMVAHKSAEALEAESHFPQLSPEWFAARDFITTASAVYGGIITRPGVMELFARLGYSRAQLGLAYSSPAKCVAKKLAPFLGADPTRWGRWHEKHANATFQAWARERVRRAYAAAGADVSTSALEFFYPGLYRFVEAPFLGVSVDCLFTYRCPVSGATVCQLAEYKAPYVLRHAPTHPYDKYPHNIPPYYYAQMALQMLVLHSFHPRWKPDHCWFGVWQPERMWVTSVPLLPPADRQLLLDAVRAFYFEDLLPALVRKANGSARDDDGGSPPSLHVHVEGAGEAAATRPAQRRRLHDDDEDDRGAVQAAAWTLDVQIDDATLGVTPMPMSTTTPPRPPAP